MTGEEPERGWPTSGSGSHGPFFASPRRLGGDGVVALGVVSGIALSLPLWAMIVAAVLALVA